MQSPTNRPVFATLRRWQRPASASGVSLLMGCALPTPLPDWVWLLPAVGILSTVGVLAFMRLVHAKPGAQGC